MKTITDKIIKNILIILLILNTNISYSLSDNYAKTSVIKLEQGCNLILDSTIVETDSLTLEIIEKIKEVIPKIQSLIQADSVTINLKISKDVVPVWGVGGNATGDHSIDFSYDPDHDNFKVDYLICGLTHEFMHVSRFRMSNWELTILECMITEGLADHFSNEVLGCSQPVWTMALSSEQIKETLAKSESVLYIKHENWDNEFNEKYFNPWMFGTNGDDPIPAWTGYSLGWALVDNYIKNHPDKKASDLVWISTKEFEDSINKLKNGN